MNLYVIQNCISYKGWSICSIHNDIYHLWMKGKCKKKRNNLLSVMTLDFPLQNTKSRTNRFIALSWWNRIRWLLHAGYPNSNTMISNDIVFLRLKFEFHGLNVFLNFVISYYAYLLRDKFENKKSLLIIYIYMYYDYIIDYYIQGLNHRGCICD